MCRKFVDSLILYLCLRVFVRHAVANRTAVCFRQRVVAALTAGLFAGVSGIEMVLAFMPLQNLAVFCDAEPFCDGFVRAEFHMEGKEVGSMEGRKG
ncbi:MAG: hypothetical protein AAB886_02345 [Patescibacteria group bacterium]